MEMRQTTLATKQERRAINNGKQASSIHFSSHLNSQVKMKVGAFFQPNTKEGVFYTILPSQPRLLDLSLNL